VAFNRACFLFIAMFQATGIELLVADESRAWLT
jgi:hypothetical protein